jgi:hypothetical protein
MQIGALRTRGVMSSLLMQFSTISLMMVSSAADTIALPAEPAMAPEGRRWALRPHSGRSGRGSGSGMSVWQVFGRVTS